MSKKKVTMGVSVVVVVVFVAGISIPAWPPSYRESTLTELCIRCGIRRQVKTAGLLDRADPEDSVASFAATPLSDWFAARFDVNCAHEWRFNHGTRQSYASLFGVRWKVLGSAGTSVTPSLVYLSPDDLATLEQLVEADPENCREYISSQLRRQVNAEPEGAGDKQ